MDDTRFIHQLNAEEARSYFCRTTSYFDMELPPYFNLQPLLEFTLSEIATLDKNALKSWNPRDHEGLNYTLMFNKDGDIGWRPFELMHPVIYSKCVDLITQKDNWKQIQDRFAEFSGGIVECCSMPVGAPYADGSAKKQQILNWWKSIEQRSLELSLEYSHISLTDGLCCTNAVRDLLVESSLVAGLHEHLVPYDVQDQELAFVQHGTEAARFALDLV